MIKGVKFVTIPVRDQNRALEFYTKKLGMRVLTDSPYDDTQRWIELGIPRADTRVVLRTGEPPPSSRIPTGTSSRCRPLDAARLLRAVGYVAAGLPVRCTLRPCSKRPLGSSPRY